MNRRAELIYQAAIQIKLHAAALYSDQECIHKAREMMTALDMSGMESKLPEIEPCARCGNKISNPYIQEHQGYFAVKHACDLRDLETHFKTNWRPTVEKSVIEWNEMQLRIKAQQAIEQIDEQLAELDNAGLNTKE